MIGDDEASDYMADRLDGMSEDFDSLTEKDKMIRLLTAYFEGGA